MNSTKGKLSVIRLPRTSTLVIKQHRGGFFLTSKDSIIIDIFGLSSLISYLVKSRIMSVKVLEGIVGEYYDEKNQSG